MRLLPASSLLLRWYQSIVKRHQSKLEVGFSIFRTLQKSVFLAKEKSKHYHVIVDLTWFRALLHNFLDSCILGSSCCKSFKRTTWWNFHFSCCTCRGIWQGENGLFANGGKHQRIGGEFSHQEWIRGKHSVWKSPKMSQFISGNTVWLQNSGFQKLAKIKYFRHFQWIFVNSKCAL